MPVHALPAVFEKSVDNPAASKPPLPKTPGKDGQTLITHDLVHGLHQATVIFEKAICGQGQDLEAFPGDDLTSGDQAEHRLIITSHNRGGLV
jgi:hypothetical protein